MREDRKGLFPPRNEVHGWHTPCNNAAKVDVTKFRLRAPDEAASEVPIILDGRSGISHKCTGRPLCSWWALKPDSSTTVAAHRVRSCPASLTHGSLGMHKTRTLVGTSHRDLDSAARLATAYAMATLRYSGKAF